MVEYSKACFPVPGVFVAICREFVGACGLKGSGGGGWGSVGTEVVFLVNNVDVRVEVMGVDGSIGAVESNTFDLGK